MKTNPLILLLIMAIVALTPAARADAGAPIFPLCEEKGWETLPVLEGGREKPLYVHARETLKFLTERTTIDGHEALAVYCQLSLMESLEAPYRHDLNLSTPMPHAKVRELLKSETSMGFQSLILQEEKIRIELMKAKEKDAYQKELEKLMGKIQLYKDVTNGRNWTIPLAGPTNGDRLIWKSLRESLEENHLAPLGIGAEKVTTFRHLLEGTRDFYVSQKGDHYLLELTYVKLRLFSWAILLVLLALGSLVAIKNRKYGLVLTGMALSLEIAGIAMRVLISGRAPVTNMYETVMFSGTGAVCLALILAIVRRETFFLVVGLSYNLCCLLMMNFANNMLNSAISPLVPVLRDNFWLSTHVTMVILSYAALALSWVLSNMVLLKRKFSIPSPLLAGELTYYNSLIYSCLKFGVVLLSGGVILGGLWADYSWGRFWGWDPKETWSLIVLLIYMAILHGKMTSWISPDRFVLFTAGAFLSVMMAWFGVNYILASGLHSYGFSQGGALFLGIFFLAQISFLVVASIRGNPQGPLSNA